jgi:hypothetical protein
VTLLHHLLVVQLRRAKVVLMTSALLSMPMKQRVAPDWAGLTRLLAWPTVKLVLRLVVLLIRVQELDSGDRTVDKINVCLVSLKFDCFNLESVLRLGFIKLT